MELDRRAISVNSGGMGVFKLTRGKVLIVIILGGRAAYLLKTQQNRPHAFISTLTPTATSSPTPTLSSTPTPTPPQLPNSERLEISRDVIIQSMGKYKFLPGSMPLIYSNSDERFSGQEDYTISNDKAVIGLIDHPENISKIDMRVELDKLDNNYDLAFSYMSGVTNAVDPIVSNWLTDAFHSEETKVKAGEVREFTTSSIVMNKRKYTVWIGVDPKVVPAFSIEQTK